MPQSMPQVQKNPDFDTLTQSKHRYCPGQKGKKMSCVYKLQRSSVLQWRIAKNNHPSISPSLGRTIIIPNPHTPMSLPIHIIIIISHLQSLFPLQFLEPLRDPS